MPTLVPCPAPILRFTDNAGNPAVGGTVLTQVGGMNYPTYQDVNGNTALPNPIPLNSRGEVSTALGASAQCFLEPGVAYTFTLYDAAGNQLWQATYVAGAQVSLYGGVDTGAANAYVLANVPNIPALQNGYVVYWIPANANTGASTINVNGLGAVAIVNVDGSALTAGQVAAGEPAEIIYYNGNWILLNPALNASSGSFVGTLTGLTTAPTVNVNWTRSGNIIAMAFVSGAVVGISNSISFTMTGVPAALVPATPGKQISVPDYSLYDNGAFVQASAYIQGGLIDFNKVGGSWTAAGQKGFENNFELIYSLL